MQNIKQLCAILRKQKEKYKDVVYNYAIPLSWDFFGYGKGRKMKQQLLVHPYDFYSTTFDLMFERKGWKDHRTYGKDWYQKGMYYYMGMKSASSYDHDRDETVTGYNLYGLKDSGTFVKAIALLPMYERMGITTLILQQAFQRGKTKQMQDYASPYAAYDFEHLDEDLYDPMAEGMDLKQQYDAFVEACHIYGIRVVFEYCAGLIGCDNGYVKQHPEWFYWIKEEEYRNYQIPVMEHMPSCIQPKASILKEYYEGESMQRHLQKFVSSQEKHKCIAPVFTDTINGPSFIDHDLTMMRFYEDLHGQIPDVRLKQYPPYISADTIRKDLYPARYPIYEVWKIIIDGAKRIVNEWKCDGLYLIKPYLLPEKLQREIVKKVKTECPSFVVIVEETRTEEARHWKQKGFDMISGGCGYEECHGYEGIIDFAYAAKDEPLTMFAGSEAYDSVRSMYQTNFTGHMLYSVMNQFLPNTTAILYSGQEMMERQPMYLSKFANQEALYALPKEHQNYYRQASIDGYSFDYCNATLSYFVQMMERVKKYRIAYKDDADVKKCIPVWFDEPRMSGLGFTYIKENQAMLVVCNSDVMEGKELYIHTEHIHCELPFTPQRAKQVFSTKVPYEIDVEFDAFQNLRLYFEAGEVKFIEIK